MTAAVSRPPLRRVPLVARCRWCATMFRTTVSWRVVESRYRRCPACRRLSPVGSRSATVDD